MEQAEWNEYVHKVATWDVPLPLQLMFSSFAMASSAFMPATSADTPCKLP